MDSESANDANPSRPRAVPWLIWFLVFLIIAYPLSLGPALALAGTRGDWLETFYAPLGFAIQNVPVVEAFYGWYLPLWGIR